MCGFKSKMRKKKFGILKGGMKMKMNRVGRANIAQKQMLFKRVLSA